MYNLEESTKCVLIIRAKGTALNPTLTSKVLKHRAKCNTQLPGDFLRAQVPFYRPSCHQQMDKK